MKALRLLEGAACPPERLAVVFKAFDEAWTEIVFQLCWRRATGKWTGSRLQASSCYLRGTMSVKSMN